MKNTGRPEENDDDPLYAMADIIVENPDMNITHVIRIVMQSMASFHSEEAVIKRLSRKFKKYQSDLIADARSRKPRPVFYMPTSFSARRSISTGIDLSSLAGISSAASRIDTSGIQRAVDMMSKVDMSGIQRAADMASRIDTSGIQRAVDMMSKVDMSAVQRAVDRVSRVDMTAVQRATDMMARLDMSAVQRATDRMNSLNIRYR